MKIFFLLGFIVPLFFACSSDISHLNTKKDFEGIITYLTTLESKTSKISTANLQALYGDTMKIYIKNGNYKMVFNGIDLKDIFYLQSNNSQYTIRHGIDSLFVSNCDNEQRKLNFSEIQNNSEVILNRKCQSIISDYGEVRNYYWYDSSIYINPINFQKHKMSYLNDYYEKAKSPWLKSRYEGTSFNLVHTAINIAYIKLDDTTFQLPNLPQSIWD